MRKNVLNVFIFVGLAVGLYFFSRYAGDRWFPPKEPEKGQTAEEIAERQKQAAEEDARLWAEIQAKKHAKVGAAGGLAVAIDLDPPVPAIVVIADAAQKVASAARATAPVPS